MGLGGTAVVGERAQVGSGVRQADAGGQIAGAVIGQIVAGVGNKAGAITNANTIAARGAVGNEGVDEMGRIESAVANVERPALSGAGAIARKRAVGQGERNTTGVDTAAMEGAVRREVA